MQELAVEKLRENPTLPPGATVDDADAGTLWPSVFCAFKGCSWACMCGGEHDLTNHLEEMHHEDLQPIIECAPPAGTAGPNRCLSVYNQGITIACRRQAPIAGSSFDRRALKAFAGACAQDNVESLVCFSCGCIYTHIADLPPAQKDIQWHRLLYPNDQHPEGFSFLGKPPQKIMNLLGLEIFLSRYDKLLDIGGRHRRLTDHESFNDWSVTLPGLPGETKLLCCPEARRNHVFGCSTK